MVAIGVGLALLLLAWWLRSSGASTIAGRSRDVAGDAYRAGEGGRRGFEPASSSGARGAVLVLDAGVRAIGPADAGRRRRLLRGHLLFDPCREPLPDAMEPPPERALATAGAVRLAYSADWIEPPAARALAAAIDDALSDAAALVGDDRREDLLVVTWPTRDALTDALSLPGWTQAVYDGAVHVVVGEDMAEHGMRSVRHEVMHAQLHASAACAPYWLDEGLAAYFEGSPAYRAMTWVRMIRTPIWIPFDSLAEPLGDDEGTEAMDPQEVSLLYAQSLGMTTMLIEDGGPGALARALAASNAGTSRRDLWQRAIPDVEEPELVDYLARRLFPDLDPGERGRLEGAAVRCRQPDPGGLPRCERVEP